MYTRSERSSHGAWGRTMTVRKQALVNGCDTWPAASYPIEQTELDGTFDAFGDAPLVDVERPSQLCTGD